MTRQARPMRGLLAVLERLISPSRAYCKTARRHDSPERDIRDDVLRLDRELAAPMLCVLSVDPDEARQGRRRCCPPVSGTGLVTGPMACGWSRALTVENKMSSISRSKRLFAGIRIENSTPRRRPAATRISPSPREVAASGAEGRRVYHFVMLADSMVWHQKLVPVDQR